MSFFEHCAPTLHRDSEKRLYIGTPFNKLYVARNDDEALAFELLGLSMVDCCTSHKLRWHTSLYGKTYNSLYASGCCGHHATKCYVMRARINEERQKSLLHTMMHVSTLDSIVSTIDNQESIEIQRIINIVRRMNYTIDYDIICDIIKNFGFNVLDSRIYYKKSEFDFDNLVNKVVSKIDEMSKKPKTEAAVQTHTTEPVPLTRLEELEKTNKELKDRLDAIQKMLEKRSGEH